MICQACGFQWQPGSPTTYCPQCGEAAGTAERPRPSPRPVTLADRSTRVSSQGEPGAASVRTATTFDVLGEGGLPLGGVMLLTGAPGIGKSSQVAMLLNHWPGTALYLSHEERCATIATRIKSFGPMASDDIFVEREPMEAEEIATRFSLDAPFLVVLDSLQTTDLNRPDLRLGSIPHVLSVRQECSRLVEWHPACTVVIIGHVTKDDHVAGPRQIEHLVDIVAHMTGCLTKQQCGESCDQRAWTVPKNRLGPAGSFVTLRLVHHSEPPTVPMIVTFDRLPMNRDRKMQQYVCPQCGQIGACHTITADGFKIPPPFCDRCPKAVVMVPSHNGTPIP